MKLISCHIENFGGLSGYDLCFCSGLTLVKEPNGFGKSTLAEFIRAMFYGFPRAGKSLEKDLRKKYLPWQGGVYGGSLTFEQTGKNYRIERTFGLVPKEDTFVLYDLDTGRKSGRFSKEVGLALFGLDSDSFVRSTYMPQTRDNSPLSTDGIRAKLGGLIEDTDDVNGYEKAIDALRSKRSALEAYRGSGGSIAKATGKISELQTQIRDCEQGRKELLLRRLKMSELKEEQDNLRQRAKSLGDEIIKASETASRITVLEQYKDEARLTLSEQANLRELKSFFAYGLPSEAEIDRQKQTLRKLEDLNEEQERFESFEKRLAKDKAQAGRASKAFISALSAGIISAGAGIISLALKHYAEGGILAGISIILLAAASYMHLKRTFSKRQAEKSYGIICGHLKKNEAELDRLKKISDRFLKRYFPDGALSEKEPDEIAMKRREYISLSKREQSLAQKRREIDDEINKLRCTLPKRPAAFCGEGVLNLPRSRHPGIEAMKSDGENIDENIEEISKKIQDMTMQVSVLQAQADKIPALNYELAMWKEKKAADMRRRDLLDTTIDFLKKARERLSLRYLDGVKNKFEGYMTRLENDGARFFVNPDLKVCVERFGAMRETAYLSVGQTDIIMLCMRLALVDELFKDAAPLIILDDPFVNLDDANTQNALCLLKNLAKGHQILYLVCNSSRSL